MFPVIVSGSLTLTRLVPRRRSPVPSLFWFIHTFCGCPRRRSHVPSHRFWSGVTPAAPAQPRAEKEKTPRSVLSPTARRLRTRTHARRDREGRPREGERERAQTERERAARSPALRSLLSLSLLGLGLDLVLDLGLDIDFGLGLGGGLGFSFGLGLGLALSFCLSPLPCTSLLIDKKLTLELQLLRLGVHVAPSGLWGEYQ